MSLISHGIFRSRISSNLETAHESRCYCHSHSAEVVAFLKKGEVTWLACHRESGAEPDEELAGSSAACRASSPAPGTGAEAGDVIRWPSPPVAFLSLVVGNLCLGRTFLAEWQTGQSSRSWSSPWTGSHNAPSPRSPPAPPVVLWDTWPRDRTGRAWVRAEPALCTPGSCPEALCCLFFSVLQHPSLKGCVSNDIKGRPAATGPWRTAPASVSCRAPAFTPIFLPGIALAFTAGVTASRGSPKEPCASCRARAGSPPSPRAHGRPRNVSLCLRLRVFCYNDRFYLSPELTVILLPV